MPVKIIEGIRGEELSDLSRRNMERRFYALAQAVRNHERKRRGVSDGVSELDEGLYRRLRQLCGEPVTVEQGTA